ncbi:class I SAM-dependent methyltransferase [Roseateles sp.]|uniref:class I SAM-dependent methyltransferase n=1 Tax=Roseateles sp. TaxID=1971397 RepID=UPI0039EC2D3F
MSDQQHHFNDPAAVANYAAGPARVVPGWADMMRMTDILLCERAPSDANVLVVGAGGGLELKLLATNHANWRFVGVDPASEMLRLAQAMLGPLASRVNLFEGYVDTSPSGPYDAATCLLTMHFVPREERRGLLKAIRQRLKPRAPLVTAHLSFEQASSERATWLARYAAFGASSGIDPEKAQAGAEAVGSRLPILSPAEDELLLREAGFSGTQLFYAGFSFRGWVSYA